MTKNKVILDLEKLNLTDKQLNNIHKSIHKVVAARLKTISASRTKKISSRGPYAALRMAAAGNLDASLSVIFTNTNPGESSLTIIHDGQSQSLTRSGAVTFNNVKHGDIILIQGYSIGNTAITIDIGASPKQMSFSPGHYVDQFLID